MYILRSEKDGGILAIDRDTQEEAKATAKSLIMLHGGKDEIWVLYAPISSYQKQVVETINEETV